MRRLIIATVVLAVLGPVAAPANGAHVSCGQTITTDTTLDSDLNCPSLPRLNIGAAGITLDLGGHILRGRVRNLGFDDVRIVNGVISDDYFPTDAITLGGVRRNEIRDITVANGSVRVTDSSDTLLARLSGAESEPLSTLVVLSGSPGTTVSGGRWLDVSAGSGNTFEGLRDSFVRAFSDNVFTGNEGGAFHVTGDRNEITGNDVITIDVTFGDENAITDNSVSDLIVVTSASSNVIARNRTAAGSQSAVILWEASSTLVADNDISADLDRPAGIWIFRGGDNRVSGNTVSGRAVGVQLEATNGNSIVQNRITDVGASGIWMYHSDMNEVLRNRVSGAGEHGIEVTSFSDDNRVERNIAIRSGFDGISILAGQGTGNLLSRNFVRFNRDDGIGVDQPGNTVSLNRAIRNFDWGIEAVEGTIDGGGNRAFANGQRAQCLNVVCRGR